MFQKLIAMLCIVAGIVSAAMAETPGHPRLLVDQQDLELLHQKIDGSFAKHWQEYRRRIDQDLLVPVELPPRGGNWSHNYVCPIHGARLKRGKKIGAWEWEHICPVGPHILKGDPSKGTSDFDGNAIAGIHGQYATEIVDCGLAYQLTHEEKYAQRAKEILLAYAGKYLSYPIHDNQGRTGSEAKNGCHVASQSLTEASWLIDVAQGADLVWDTLSKDEQKQVETKLLRPALEECIIPHVYGIHNIQCRENAAIVLVGLLLNDQALVSKAIDDPKTGFRQQIAKGVQDDGMWIEGSFGYHFFTIAGLSPLAEAARHAGIDLYSPRFKSMFDAPMEMVMPDFRLPNFNDSGIVDLSSEGDAYELAYARWHDPRYLPLLHQGARGGRLAFLYGVAELPAEKDAKAQTTGSHNSLASGYAILEQGAGTDATWMCLKYGAHGGGHGHFDKNHFILYSKGKILFPDVGTHAYGSALHGGYDKQSLAHNTLVVDEESQQPARGKSLAFGSIHGVDYSITDAGDIYKGVRFVRTALMLDPMTIVLIDQVSSDQEHTYDMVFHMTGKWQTGHEGEAWTAPKKSGYPFITDPRIAPAHGPITVSQTTLTLAENEPTQLISGTAVGETTEDQIPVAIFRRHGKSMMFASAISLEGKTKEVQVLSADSVRVGGEVFEVHPDDPQTPVRVWRR
jgi:oligo-alginate lyase